jgi:hypothetical protein
LKHTIIENTEEMRIVKDGITALVSEMLCLEHGARLYDSELQLMPKPHELWPTVTIKPKTKHGFPQVVHYQPTVGIVLYCLPRTQTIASLVKSVAKKLEEFDVQHLTETYKLTGAVSCMTGRQAIPHVDATTVVVGPQPVFRKCAPETARLPARLLQWTPSDLVFELPRSHSIRAAFTWVFMPLHIGLHPPPDPSKSLLNMLLASIVYDATNICIHDAGTDVDWLKRSDIVIDIEDPLNGYDCFLINPDGKPLLIRDYSVLSAKPKPPLPIERWTPSDLYMPQRFTVIDMYICNSCNIPLGDECIVLRQIEIDSSPILYGESASAEFLVCIHCWNSFNIPSNVSYKAFRTSLPFSQAENLAKNPKRDRHHALLTCKITTFPAIPGVYIATAPDGSQKILMDHERHQRYDCLSMPKIIDLNLPVIPMVMIIAPRK